MTRGGQAVWQVESIVIGISSGSVICKALTTFRESLDFYYRRLTEALWRTRDLKLDRTSVTPVSQGLKVKRSRAIKYFMF